MQWLIIVFTLLAIGALAFAMNRSIKKYEAKPKLKKKKGRNRYMPQSKNPGRK
jgi:hypothetical protein